MVYSIDGAVIYLVSQCPTELPRGTIQCYGVLQSATERARAATAHVRAGGLQQRYSDYMDHIVLQW